MIIEERKSEYMKNKKPRQSLERVERCCIGSGCERNFIAKGRFNRLCDTCSEYAARYA